MQKTWKALFLASAASVAAVVAVAITPVAAQAATPLSSSDEAHFRSV